MAESYRIERNGLRLTLAVTYDEGAIEVACVEVERPDVSGSSQLAAFMMPENVETAAERCRALLAQAVQSGALLESVARDMATVLDRHLDADERGVALWTKGGLACELECC